MSKRRGKQHLKRAGQIPSWRKPVKAHPVIVPMNHHKRCPLNPANLSRLSPTDVAKRLYECTCEYDNKRDADLAAIAAEGYKGRKNAYHCETCGGYIVTIDVDSGVTPMFLGCRAADECKGRMASMMYPPEPWGSLDSTPGWEWYRPSERAARKMDSATFEHVKQGGLLLRRIEA